MDPKLIRASAGLRVAVGVLGLISTAAFVASHFVFRAPIYLGNTGRLASDWQIGGLCTVLAVGFCSIGGLGAYRLFGGAPSQIAPQHPRPLIDAICTWLYWPVLVLAWIDVVLVLTSVAGLPPIIIQGALWTTGAMAALHFAMALFDGQTHRAVNAYNARVFERMAKRLSQEDQLADLKNGPLVKATVYILFGEMALAMLFRGQNPGPPMVFLLAFSAFFLIVCFVMLQMKTLGLPAAAPTV